MRRYAVLAIVVTGSLIVSAQSVAAPKSPPRDLVPLRLEGVSAFPQAQVFDAAGVDRSLLDRTLGRKPRAERRDLGAKAEAVRLFYQRQGYFEATTEILPPSGAEPAILRVSEGSPCRVASISVRAGEGGPPDDIDRTALAKDLPLKQGAVFSADDYEASATLILFRLREDGRPFAEVIPEAVVDLADLTAAASYTIKPGERCTVGTITFLGMKLAEERVLRRALAFAPGDLYRQSKVEESRDALYKLGLFDAVTFVNQPGSVPGTVDIRVRLREGKLHRIRLGLGYGSEDGIRGLVRWETLRFASHTLQVGAEAKGSAIDSRLQTYLRRPYLWDRKTTGLADLTLGQRVEEDFRYDYLKAQAGLQRQFTPHLQGSSFLVLERVLQFTPDQALKDAIGSGARDIATMASVAVGIVFRTTDEPLNPTRGTLLNLYVEPTQVLDPNGPFFTKTILEGRQFVGLGQGWVLGFRLKVGAIYAGASRDEVPLSRRFYAGGANSVRGYAYNSLGPMDAHGALIGGDGLLEASTELRFPLKGELTGLVFADTGNAFAKPFKIRSEELRAGAGLGVRYQTPVGPIGLDLAWRLKKDALNPSPYQVYFFIGYAF
jgi:outer membrane protein assembly complex protein YaeT